jgi:hypothetical protein
MTMAITALLLLLLQSATAPTTAPSTEADLRHIIATMQRQVAELRAENASLRHENAELKTKVAKLTPPSAGSGEHSSADYKRLSKGMTMEEVLAIMGTPQERSTDDNTITLRWTYGGGMVSDPHGAPVGRSSAFHVDLVFADDKLTHTHTYTN